MKVYIVFKSDGYCMVIDKIFSSKDASLKYLETNAGNSEEFEVDQ